MPRVVVPITPDGVLVDLIVDVTPDAAAARRSAGLPSLVPFKMTAILDTGSDATVIPLEPVEGLELVHHAQAELFHAFGDEAAPAFEYDVSLFLVDEHQRHVRIGTATISVVGAALDQDTPYHAIIGRDVLNLISMHYDGRPGLATVEF